MASVLEHRLPGYHQYFPATTIQVHGYPIAEQIHEQYAHVPLRRPIEDIASLVDISAIADDVGWQPQARLSVDLER